jgi:hypothetical protein
LLASTGFDGQDRRLNIADTFMERALKSRDLSFWVKSVLEWRRNNDFNRSYPFIPFLASLGNTRHHFAGDTSLERGNNQRMADIRFVTGSGPDSGTRQLKRLDLRATGNKPYRYQRRTWTSLASNSKLATPPRPSNTAPTGRSWRCVRGILLDGGVPHGHDLHGVTGPARGPSSRLPTT